MAALTTIYYPGSKTRAARQILSLYPCDTKRLVSPFFGSGALETAAARRGWHVHGSDIFEPLVNYHQQVQINAEAVARRVGNYYPPSRAVAERIRANYKEIADPLERAAAFFVLNRTSISGFTLARTGFCDTMKPGDLKNSRARLAGWQWPRTLSIECLDFEEALERHPSIPAYLDPPYLKSCTSIYGNKNDNSQAFDHERLARCLKARSAPWVLSYNANPTVLGLYAGCKILKPKWKYSMGRQGFKNNFDGHFSEVLILNF